MSLLPDLSRRSIESEQMDQPDSDPQQLAETLKQFSVINRFITPSQRLFKKHFLAPMLREPGREWTLLDVGAGAGDFAIHASKLCGQLGITLNVTCLDHDARVVEFAKKACRSFDNIEILHADIGTLSESSRHWDFVFANHFLHHLSDEQIILALREIQRLCQHTYVLADLWRNYASYYGYTLLAGVCFRDSFCYEDGRLSIRRGFTKKELLKFIEAAGLESLAYVQWNFPGHFSVISHPNTNQIASSAA